MTQNTDFQLPKEFPTGLSGRLTQWRKIADQQNGSPTWPQDPVILRNHLPIKQTHIPLYSQLLAKGRIGNDAVHTGLGQG